MRRLRIGPRLTTSFVAITLILFVGSGLTLWQVSNMDAQARRVHEADLQAYAVLRVDRNVLALQDSLRRLARARDSEGFVSAAGPLSQSFHDEVEQTIDLLAGSPPGAALRGDVLADLNTVRDTLPAEVDRMTELARAGDWPAVQDHLENQMGDLTEVSRKMVEQIDRQVAVEQDQALDEMQSAEASARFTLLGAAALGILAAGVLGELVTRSIAEPLGRIDTAAQALARGDFRARADVPGRDELAQLGKVLNRTAEDLSALTADLEERVGARTRDLSRRTLQLETHIAVVRQVTSILDLETLLHDVCELIRERYGYYYVGIYLVDASGESLWARTGTGQAGRTLKAQGFHIKVSDEGILGWVAGHRKAACVPDVSRDSRYLALAAMPDTRAELALPLLHGGRLLGVLDIQGDQAGDPGEDDLPVLQALADQVAVAIQNAALYAGESSRRRLAETLYEVGRALTGTLSMARVLDLTLEHLSRLVSFDHTMVLLPEGEGWVVAAARGAAAEAAAQHTYVPRLQGSLYDALFQHQEPIAIADVLGRDDFEQLLPTAPVRAWLGIPLVAGSDCLGVLTLSRSAPVAYDAESIALASAFAGQAAIALENARLYERITEFNQQLEARVQERTEALQMAYSQLERLDRTKSDFINITAHELRTPLTVLKGYSEILYDDINRSGDKHYLAMVQGIHSGAQRLHQIVDSMLDVLKVDNRLLQLFPSPLALEPVLESVRQGFAAALAERHLILELDGLGSLPPVEADLDALHKVFYHLIVNAIKYTPDGGRIRVSGRAVPAGTGRLAVEGVEVVVADSGIGIAPDAHALIFGKFYQSGRVDYHSSGQTKFKGGGPGLGLTIARGIVEAHCGVVWVESPGYDEERCPGIRFYVALPLRQPAG